VREINGHGKWDQRWEAFFLHILAPCKKVKRKQTTNYWLASLSSQRSGERYLINVASMLTALWELQAGLNADRKACLWTLRSVSSATSMLAFIVNPNQAAMSLAALAGCLAPSSCTRWSKTRTWSRQTS
jgi:hypothetical protein